MTYWIFKDVTGQYRWHLSAGNNRIIATSGESYHNEADCLSAIGLVKGSSQAPIHRANY